MNTNWYLPVPIFPRIIRFTENAVTILADKLQSRDPHEERKGYFEHFVLRNAK